jgi:DNA-binding LytR/AlgR family response regulator
VATDQITAARRDGPRAIVTLADGRDYPVSRSHLKALEQTGLLPPR